MIKLFFSDNHLPASYAIKFLTWSEYSHVGFILDDENLLDSTFMAGGVKIRKIEDVKKHSSKFLVREYPRISSDAINWAKSQLNKPYDLTAIIGIPFHRNWQDESKWFCSELVAWACLKAGTPIVNKESWRITPQDELQAI